MTTPAKQPAKNTRSPWDLRQMAREAFMKGKHTQANDLSNEADRLEDQLFNDDARRVLVEKHSQDAVKREVAARRQARSEAAGEASMVTPSGGKA